MNYLECSECGAMNHPEGPRVCFQCEARLTEEMEIPDGLQKEINQEQAKEEFQKEQAYQMHKNGSVF